ncbi:CobW family GTP-binding protein [Glutamicibacter endophyticus]|uniref:CobW family GTP-binding protein n=1 Tax=Glutamicibacter endophyticus TaxID=1522174 RepID=UPI003AF113B8
MIPVIALTGHLGAGKTSVLNQLLSRPGTRVGVIINDAGAINVDAGLLTSQVDAAESIAGGCVCCLNDSGPLDELLEKLSAPRLRLDAIIVETSGLADPVNVAQLLRFSQAENVRFGGIVDVLDAVEHERTVDTGGLPPARYAATSLVLVNKMDLLEPAAATATLERITARVRERNALAPVLPIAHAAVDPELIFDVANEQDPEDQLPLAELARASHHRHTPHVHAVTVPCPEPADPGAVLDLLASPPPGAYRLKGVVPFRLAGGRRARYRVNVVGRTVHFEPPGPGADPSEDGLVAVGMELCAEEASAALGVALSPSTQEPSARSLTRLERQLILSGGAR